MTLPADLTVASSPASFLHLCVSRWFVGKDAENVQSVEVVDQDLNERLFEVCRLSARFTRDVHEYLTAMDHACCLRRLRALADRPLPDLVRPCGEKAP